MELLAERKKTEFEGMKKYKSFLRGQELKNNKVIEFKNQEAFRQKQIFENGPPRAGPSDFVPSNAAPNRMVEIDMFFPIILPLEASQDSIKGLVNPAVY